MSSAQRWTLEIGRASAQDISAIVELGASSDDMIRWPATAWQTFVEEHRQQDIERRGVLLLGRTTESELTGWIAGTVLDNTAEVEFVFVHPRFRGHGIASQLLQAWVSWAGEQGASEVWLEVRASNQAALQLYGSMGFTAHGRRRAYYRDPVDDAVLMQLRVNKGHDSQNL